MNPLTERPQPRELQQDRESARVLLVDDEPGLRFFCRRALELVGLECGEASGGAEALEALYADPYDVVLLDVEMKEVNGPEVLRRLRQSPPRRGLKIIMHSGAASQDEMARLLSAGADDYLAKPCTPVQLQERVLGAVRLQRDQDRSAHLTQDLEEASRELEHCVALRTAELTRMHANNERLLAAISSVLIGLDASGNITDWNKVAEEVFGLPAQSVLNRPFADVSVPWEDPGTAARLLECACDTQQTRLENLPFRRPDGKRGFLELCVTPIMGEADGTRSGALLLGADLTERRLLEAQLVQAQKLESIGQLAAGIAHEINTPIQYVGDNSMFLRDAFRDLCHVLDGYDGLAAAVREGTVSPAHVAELERLVAEMDLAYLRAEIPRAIEQSLEGVGRVAHIVRAMKEFSHPGGEDKVSVDLNHAIENTITVARNEWKYVAEVVTDFDTALPPVPCHADELNQVILNLLVNASHAIGSSGASEQKGTISVRTRRVGGQVEIQVGDTGCGIPKAIRSKVFDPFFTTKPVGKGTGQGLAIAHAVVVKKHGGTITFDSEEGSGTTFRILLPLEAATAA